MCVALAHAPLLASEAEAPSHGLMTVDQAWTKAMMANDAAACAALYAEDAVLVLPGTPAISGRKAIQAAYEAWLKEVKVFAATISDAQYASSGDVSGGWGRWSVTSVPHTGGSPMIETGTWSAVAVRKDGAWLYASDHASADPPAAR